MRKARRDCAHGLCSTTLPVAYRRALGPHPSFTHTCLCTCTYVHVCGGPQMDVWSMGACTLLYMIRACACARARIRGGLQVDVWSMGVIFYQMLYGKRPFGEGMTQEALARQGVLLNASQVRARMLACSHACRDSPSRRSTRHPSPPASPSSSCTSSSNRPCPPSTYAPLHA